VIETSQVEHEDENDGEDDPQGGSAESILRDRDDSTRHHRSVLPAINLLRGLDEYTRTSRRHTVLRNIKRREVIQPAHGVLEQTEDGEMIFTCPPRTPWLRARDYDMSGRPGGETQSERDIPVRIGDGQRAPQGSARSPGPWADRAPSPAPAVLGETNQY